MAGLEFYYYGPFGPIIIRIQAAGITFLFDPWGQTGIHSGPAELLAALLADNPTDYPLMRRPNTRRAASVAAIVCGAAATRAATRSAGRHKPPSAFMPPRGTAAVRLRQAAISMAALPHCGVFRERNSPQFLPAILRRWPCRGEVCRMRTVTYGDRTVALRATVAASCRRQELVAA